MGRLATVGAETNDVTTEGLTNASSMTIQATNVYSGSFAFRAPTTGAQGDIAFTGVLGRTYYSRVRLYVNTGGTPGATRDLVYLFTAANNGAKLRMNTDLTLRMTDGANNVLGSPSSALNTGQWYLIEFAANVGTGSVDTAEFRIDGVSISAVTAQALSENAFSTMRWGTSGSTNTGNWDFDDVALNDDQGANQNTWAGDSREVLLKPISDNAVGTGWTLGTGTAIASNGFGSVDNTPPTGVADLAAGSDPKQIRNASSTANTNYDANLTTYFNAGIGPNSTINVLDPIVATAAPVVTSAKQGTVGIVSNPAIANIALGAGGTAGAFWQGTAGGTYPTGWKISHGTITYAPSVTVGTSPVMRITQVTASTRIAVVCFMGMYVDYTPGSLGSIRTVKQAVKRAASY